MLILGMFQWWYTRGWHLYLRHFIDQLKNAVDFFSVGLLVRHLFAPFRQISAGQIVSSDLSTKFSALIDRLFSRVIGTIVRLFLLVVGTIVIILRAIFGAIIAVLWPLTPFLIVVCLFCALIQVRF